MLTAGIWAFSSVGRASPLQGEGQKFESSNAHHLKQEPKGSFLVTFCVPTYFRQKCKFLRNGFNSFVHLYLKWFESL